MLLCKYKAHLSIYSKNAAGLIMLINSSAFLARECQLVEYVSKTETGGEQLDIETDKLSSIQNYNTETSRRFGRLFGEFHHKKNYIQENVLTSKSGKNYHISNARPNFMWP